MARVTLEEWGKRLEATLIKCVNAGAHELADKMSELTPRDTGTAAAGYTVIPATMATPAHIKNEVPYIMYLNDGTVHNEPHQMKEKAIAAFNPNLNRFDK